MTNLTNGELYNMLLDRLRKDRKGSISPEEFENFLKWRNLDYFNKQLGVEGVSKTNHESLSPFMVTGDAVDLSEDRGEYYIALNVITGSGVTTTTPDTGTYLTYRPARIVNVWHSSSITDYSSKIKVDLLHSSELANRLNNAITAPSSSYPVAYLAEFDSTSRMYVWGVTTGYVILDYYKYPAEPYFDYYTDASGNVTYLTDGQPSYTLKAGEIARDGSTAGDAVTSASEDLGWNDYDAINILDMVVSDVSIALSDPESLQASLLERKENVTA